MLPSTGYFKTINCPFYESGSCDRPYCHFKHARKDDTTNILGISTAETTETVTKINEGVGTSLVATPDSDALQKLVTETVKKILATQEVSDTDKISENIVTKVVEELKPTLACGSLVSSPAVPEPSQSNELGKHTGVPSSISKCVYNPTPIAELKKRHIPIASYIPTRESKVSAKRKISPDRSKSLLSFIHASGNNYSSNEIYKPTSIGIADTTSIPSYVPTARSDSSPANSYDDSNSSEYFPRKSKEQYFPKVKKRREEYVPRRIKHPLKTVQQLEESIEEDTVLEFARKFETIDKLLLEDETDVEPINEESHEYESIDPKFSDDESEDENLIASTDEVKELEDVSKVKNVEEKENTDIEQIEKKEENTDSKSHKISSSSSSSKSTREHSNSSKSQSKDQSKREKSRSEKSQISKHDERKKSEGKSESKNSKNETSKDKHSSSKNKEHSSSSSRSKDKNKEKDAHKEREKDRSSDRSKSSKDSKSKDSKESKDLKSKNKKDYKSEKEREGSRDSKQDKHKSEKHKSRSKSSSSSSSRKDKHKSHKCDDKHHSSYKSSSSNHKHNSSSKKTIKSKRDKSEDRDFGSELEGMHFNFEDEEPMEISDSDHDVEEECFKIFQEYEVSDQKDVTKKQSYKRHIKEVDDAEEVVVKKRIAYPSATSMSSQLPERKEPKKVINPHQKLYERWKLLKAAAANSSDKNDEYVPEQIKPTSSKYISESSSQSVSSKNETQLNGNGRIRIAHVPYAMSLALEKKKVLENASSAMTKTVAQTTKTGSRVAHIPVAIPQLIRPEPMQVSTQKFPANVRQHYVNIMHDICVQIYTNGEDAVNRATREEYACHERCKALPVYKNSCMLAAHRLRKEVDQGTDASSMSSASGIVSHEAVLAGKSKGSWSVIKSKKSVTDLHGANLYYMLSKWIMTEQQLKDNGFPRPHPDGPRGRAKVYVINTRNHSIISKVPNERFCSRCNQPYIIDRFGIPVKKENCIYHYGRKFTYRGEGKYSCCQQDSSASGCCDAKSHVWDYVDVENLRGYVTTLPKETDLLPEEQGVYALDCEMCYTTQGLELTRITVINEDCHVVYETLVKPEHPILDYNTRFSGITEENMKDVSTTLLDVQATLLTMFSDKTILVGHSLESDFKALKLIHDTVVDTSIMFPHRNGYPQKRALKNLCSEYLRKIIQNDVGGHDSNEDAMACMELVLWKVKEEAKLI
ncbi:RNA exonuclease 1 homolog isoform X2 [Leptopilina boulardi]|uniref:RNA exonuclease 1 homolog isoform X2 n=1 Tax=Leptopilina boulardi TaxID=63433 RepID=UPI0021F656A0|nr:RNA exonuclease 1 homolog isoform X2 [Leptopilina boulardi]